MNPLLGMAGAEAAKAIGGGIVGLGIDMATAKWRMRQQMEQQRKMQEMQIQGQKEMGKYNQDLALDTWNKTNYEAQRKHMENAGLSVGLMYGQGGGGGATTASNPGGVTGGTAEMPNLGMGMQTGIQAATAAANIKLMESQANLNNVEAKKKGGADTAEAEARTGESQARAGEIKQNTQNQAIHAEILELDKKLKEIQLNIGQQTQLDVIRNVRIANNKLAGEAEKAKNEGKMSTEAYNDQLKQIEQSTIEQQLRMGAIKAGILKTNAETEVQKVMLNKMATEIRKMGQDIEVAWANWSTAEQQAAVQKVLAGLKAQEVEFNTNTAAHAKQWTSVIGDVMSTMKMMPTGSVKGFGK